MNFAEDATQVLVLSRLTLDYSANQDRMKLAGVTAEGSFVIAWLSLRLLARLIPHLLNRCETLLPPALQNEEHSETLNQSVAPEEPVIPSSGALEFLARSADISQAAGGLIVAFRDEDNMVRFVLPKTNAMRWLGGLRKLYQVAEWPMDVWQGFDQILVSPEEEVGSVTLH